MSAYPQSHFPGTPPLGRWVVQQAVAYAQVNVSKWTIPLEAIARYESDWDPSVYAPSGARGLMGLSNGQYSAHEAEFGWRAEYENPIQAMVVSIRYIQSELVGYGGYGNIGQLLERNDRGPGDVLRKWIKNPEWTYSRLRQYYHGY